MTFEIRQGDARAVLATLPEASVQCVVTSPPYWGLRAYGTEHQVWGGDPACQHDWDALETREITGGGGNKGNAGSFVPVGACGACGACGAWLGELGLEPTPEMYVEHLVEIFRGVRRVLRDDGTLWLNLGDCYATGAGAVGDCPGGGEQGARWRGDVDRIRDDMRGYRGERLANGRGDQPAILRKKSVGRGSHTAENSGKAAPRLEAMGPMTQPNRMPIPGLKPKDLCMIPARVAMALQQPYYSGQIKDAGERRWLAGVIDGEGCIYISRSKAGSWTGRGRRSRRSQDAFDVGVRIVNTSERLIDEVRRIVGYGNVRPSANHGRQAFDVAAYSSRGRELLREVYPYLVAKQHEARLAYACPPSGDLAAAAHAALKDLHHGRPVDLDCPPPTSCYESGWWLRSDIIWAKPNPMPESVRDRPTKAHEYLFLLAKSERYYYDAEAIAEPFADERMGNPGGGGNYARNMLAGAAPGGRGNRYAGLAEGVWNKDGAVTARNRRSVWEIATQPFAEAHFAVMPQQLVEPCVLAGSKPGDLVLDPFAGSGTVGVVALRHGRRFLGCDLNRDYCAMARKRIAGPLFAQEGA